MSPNWLGDVVMALPAVRAVREAEPATRIAVLAKVAVAPVWEIFGLADEVIVLGRGNRATFRTADKLRKRRGEFDTAYVLPNSFRSALIVWLAGIKRRRGTRGNWRWWMLNEVVPMKGLEREHQKKEYGRILEIGKLENYDIAKSNDWKIKSTHNSAIPQSRNPVILIPGAARGESKRWPFFAEAAKLILDKKPETRFVVCGAGAEKDLCEDVANKIGNKAESVAGKTDLKEFAELLAGAELVICNDSGGMHLASALGTPVVAVYGLTDPAKTGPIGGNAEVVRPKGVKISRDIARKNAAAAAALRSVPAECVAEIAFGVLENRANCTLNEPSN